MEGVKEEEPGAAGEGMESPLPVCCRSCLVVRAETATDTRPALAPLAHTAREH